MRRILSWLMAVSAAGPVWAQDTPGRLTVAAAVSEALRTHPEILAAQRRHEAALQRPTQEGSLEDPMISAGYTSAGNPLPGAGLGSDPNANIGFMVSQALPFKGKRGARVAVAAREADAELQQVEAARLSVASQVKQAYYSLAASRATATVLERNRELLATLLQVSQERYAVGQAAQQDVIKAQTQLSVLELQQHRIQQEARSREGQLNALLSRPAHAPIGAVEELAFTPFVEQLEALIARATANAPMVKRDQLMFERARLAVDVAKLDYKPDFSVSGGYAYTGSMPAMYEFRVDLNIPLQRKRRAAAVAEQLSLAAAADQTLKNTRLDIQGRLHVDFEMASTTARLAALYRDTVLPQARLALESSLASYQAGRVDFLTVLTNFSMVLEYEITYFDELGELHRAISRLEEMTGAPIPH